LIKKEIDYIPGLFKIFSEIVDNSSDEICVRGYGDTINMEYNYDEGEFKISDNGRGIPLEKHKETGKYFPELVFAQLRAGSNFDDSARKTSGMNGVGATLTSIFSEFLYIKIKRDGKIYEQNFKSNLSKVSEPKIEKNNKQKGTGTSIYFKPDYTIFKQKLPIELVKKRCLELTVMYNMLTINLRIINSGKNEDISYKNKKFEDFIKLFDTTYSIYEDIKSNTKLAICNNKISENFEHFSNINGIDTFRGGNHVDSVKELFCESFKEKIYKEIKLEVNNQDVSKHMIVVLFQIWNAPHFEGQTKEKFVNDKKEVKQFFDNIISSRRITSMYSELEDMKKSIIDDVMAKNERKNLLELKGLQKNIDRKKIPKLIDCSSKDRLKCSIYITEGDSAIANLARVRDSKYMAGLPLRGKIMNVLESTDKEVLANKELQSLMSVIGLKIGQSPLEIRLGKIEKCILNYGKIIISTDQDMDGYSIRCLMVNFLFKYWPELFQYGFVYILETPLYEIIDNKNKTIEYFYNKEDYETYMEGKQSNSNRYDISYFKGLGSCGKEAWDYMINKNPNYLQIISPDKILSTNKLQMAFGDESDPRKEWLMN
jgi:DNA gyrase/topoisomerase IV subunit B